jgi:hypothetical protein
MEGLFEGYGAQAVTGRKTGATPWDEMFAEPSTVRASYREIHSNDPG